MKYEAPKAFLKYSGVKAHLITQNHFPLSIKLIYVSFSFFLFSLSLSILLIKEREHFIEIKRNSGNFFFDPFDCMFSLPPHKCVLTNLITFCRIWECDYKGNTSKSFCIWKLILLLIYTDLHSFFPSIYKIIFEKGLFFI